MFMCCILQLIYSAFSIKFMYIEEKFCEEKNEMKLNEKQKSA